MAKQPIPASPTPSSLRRRTGLMVAAVVSAAIALPTGVLAGAPEAFDHLDRVMDEYTNVFGVFEDLGAAGNHFAARCASVPNPSDPAELAAITFDETWSDGCHGDDGGTCIRATFDALYTGFWGGYFFLNGTLDADEVLPSCNWGESPGAGFDLTGATQLTYWAKGETDGLEVEIFVGGVGWNPETGEQIAPYPESHQRVPALSETVKLSTEWQEFTIDLSGLDLSYALSGIAWVASQELNPDGATFYLDDVSFDLARPDELRLLRSFQTVPGPPVDAFDTILQNVAWSYDNAIVLLAYLSRGVGDDLARAELLADAFVYAIGNDRYFDDGRIRNAYQAGDLVLPPGWTPNGRPGTARLPGWWDDTGKEWVEDPDQVGTSTGNIGWVMLALLRAYQVLGHQEYLDASATLGEWAEAHAKAAVGLGYTGGYRQWEPVQEKLFWKSTEHNLDLYVGFMTLFDITGDPVWRGRSLDAKAFVRSMWEACGAEHFATGTLADGMTPNCAFQPVDVNTWGLMGLGEKSLYGRGTRWSVLNARVVEACFDGADALGLDFNDDRDGIWWEGTAHTAIAVDMLGLSRGWDILTKNLTDAQALAPRADGEGIVATCHDGVSTGIPDFFYYNRLHTAATAWYGMAMGHHNPLWGIGTGEPIPHQGE